MATKRNILNLLNWNHSPTDCLYDWAATLSEKVILVWEFEVAVLYVYVTEQQLCLRKWF